VAGGYSGHGNALGLACGDLVARAILGERPPELEIFDLARASLAWQSESHG
jgi:glycine/D-amino acid oxidase-like deaminating enzyme